MFHLFSKGIATVKEPETDAIRYFLLVLMLCFSSALLREGALVELRLGNTLSVEVCREHRGGHRCSSMPYNTYALRQRIPKHFSALLHFYACSHSLIRFMLRQRALRM